MNSLLLTIQFYIIIANKKKEREEIKFIMYKKFKLYNSSLLVISFQLFE